MSSQPISGASTNPVEHARMNGGLLPPAATPTNVVAAMGAPTASVVHDRINTASSQPISGASTNPVQHARMNGGLLPPAATPTNVVAAMGAPTASVVHDRINTASATAASAGAELGLPSNRFSISGLVHSIAGFFSGPDDHEIIFHTLRNRLPHTLTADFAHLVVSFGGIEGEEISTKIGALLENYEWDLSSLQRVSYWNLFARHVTSICLRPFYFNQKDYLPLFIRVAQTVDYVVHLQIRKAPNEPIVLHTIRVEPKENDAFSPKEFGFFNPRIAYDESTALEHFGRIFHPKIKHVHIGHTATLEFFKRIILPMQNLESLELQGYIFSSGMTRITGEELQTCLAGLPRTIKSLGSMADHFINSDKGIEFLVGRFPALETFVCGWGEGQPNQPCSDAALNFIGRLKNLRSLHLRNCAGFTPNGFSKLSQCIHLVEFVCSHESPPIPILSDLLPKALEKLTIYHNKNKSDACDVTHLEKFQNLRRLTLHEIASDGFLIQRLAQAVPLLECLDLKKCKISTDEVDHFLGFRNLKELTIGDFNCCEHLEPHVKRLQKKLPNLKITLIHFPRIYERSKWDGAFGM